MKTAKVAIFSRGGGGGNLIALAALALTATSTATAGVKYWDNPGFKEFDVGDYVQDGLVVNYDGIRNAGPDLPHDPDATTWVNCANPGTYDQLRYSLVDAAWVAGDTEGKWADDGFVFNTNAVFHESASFTVPAKYTIQTLVDAKPSQQTPLNYEDAKIPVGTIGYVMCDYNASQWNNCSIGMRNNAYTYNGTSYKYSFYLCTAGASGTTRPAIVNSADFACTYATAMGNGSSGAVFFSGTEAPWSATEAKKGHSTATISAVTFSNGFCIGGHYPSRKEYFKGTIKNLRLYTRCLTDTEVLWNRLVDDARYFRVIREITVIPVTNVVESCTIPGIRDYHYAIDAEGNTFTAPAQRTVEGKRYALSGYTLETWNGTTWGAPVTHDGEYSYTATDTTALVRLTWQYSRPEGEGRLKVYNIGDYVTEELLVHYDGICNAGTDVAHDYDATTWVNLGSGGASYDLTLTEKTAGNQGYWLGNGYRFEGCSTFASAKHNGNWLTYTFQWVVDGKKSEQKYTLPYLFSASWSNFAFAMGNNPKTGCFHYNTQGATYRPYILNSAKEYTYGTAISDAENNEIKFFEGTTAPTSGDVADGYHKFTDDATMKAFTYSNGSYNVGGYGAADGQFVGVVKNLRIYTKVLDDNQIAHNRRVDNYRYFGIYEPEATNVLVQSTYSYLEGYDKCGPYEVDGSYTFVAPDEVTAPNGIKYACDGYTVETWNGTDWVDATTHSGNSYFYSTTAGKVRLTWRWKAAYGRRTAADYTIDDLASGAVLHFDGIYNAGLGTHSDSATKWTNLGTAGSNLDASLAGTADDSEWMEYGYNFKGKRKFMTPNETAKYVHIASSYTLQSLVDAPYADNTHTDGNYILATGWNTGSIQIRGTPKTTWFLTQKAVYDDRPRYTETGDAFSFATVILDNASRTAVAFPGTKAPTSGTPTTGYKQFSSDLDSLDWYVHIGGANLGSGQFLRGILKSIRYYDRVLTEEELVRNRNVDSVRYFGELATTNVVYNGTAYKVEGAYTWNAPATVDEDGKTRNTAGYWLETSDGTKTWHEWEEGESHEFTYDTAERNDTVTLTWGGPRPGMLIIVR